MKIIGNERIEEAIQKSAQNHQFFHAYLFSGPANLGKKTLALQFAELLKCSKNDIHILEKSSAIKIDEVRDLQHKLLLSSQSEFKIMIIDDASNISNQAASALLKTLEEPTKNTVIVLITSNKSKVLPTIISRCINYEFSLVSKEKINILLDDFNLSEQERNQILQFSQGRPGIALALANNRKGILARQSFISNFSNLLNSDINSKFIFVEKIYKESKENYNKIINLWTSFFRDCLLLKSNNQELILNQANLNELNQYSKNNSKEKIINLINYLTEINNAAIINEKLALENFFLKV
ncbi:MAG: AAA family ATPase [Patescibacteria group bacterium]|nr:AAA family ATPase [Patescibacteria group bacterium]